MLGTRSFTHRLFSVGALFKCTYLFVLVSAIIICLFCYSKEVQSASDTTQTLEGKVVEIRSGTRIVGDTVRIVGLEKDVQTDANGQFKFLSLIHI